MERGNADRDSTSSWNSAGAVVVVQLIWTLLILIPLYVYFALAVYLVLRSWRRQAAADAFVAQKAERQCC
jgi:peptidoglycan/LPS O-acetylase OafA/YrhL